MSALSATVLAHFRQPRNHRRMDAPTAAGEAANASCGDRIELSVRVEADGRVGEAAFQGEACSVAVAVTSRLTELVAGLTRGEALAITTAALVESLGGVPDGRLRCAALPVSALATALGAGQGARAAMQGVAAIVLAAGSATRFGGSKLTALVDGEPVVRRSVGAMLGGDLERVIVVVGGPHEASVRAALEGMPVDFVTRAGEGGLGDSLAAGVAHAARDAAMDAVLVALGDQPSVPAEAAAALAEAWRASGATVVVPHYRGARGHPVLFARALFSELVRCAGDRGAAGIIASLGDRVAAVELDAELPVDIDTPAELANFMRPRSPGAGTVVRQVR